LTAIAHFLPHDTIKTTQQWSPPVTVKFLCFFLVVLLGITSPLYAGENQITVQLQWLNQFQFAGYYVAHDLGFYHDAGLDVTIKEYTPGIDTVEEVLAQRADFATGKSSLFLERLLGKPIVVLGAIFQNSPEILISTKPQITSPADLAGKRIMITQDQATATCLLSMLTSQGVNLDDLQLQPHSSRLADLIAGKTDAMACYLSNEPYQLQQAGVPFKVFNPADYGFSSYGDLVFTSEEQITQHPKRTRDFYTATIRGWQWAFDHIEETAQLIFNHYNSQQKSLDSLIYEGQVLKQLALTDDQHIGPISRERISQTLELYRLTGLANGKAAYLDQGIDPLGFNKHELKIGILAHRGATKTLKRWGHLAHYLNNTLEDFHTTLVPLTFKKVGPSIENHSIDFLLANPALYVELENRYGLSRIATLLNRTNDQGTATDHYGSVIFTLKNHPVSLEADMFSNKSLAAVNPSSLGGWLMALEALNDHDVNFEGIDLNFLCSHDAVVFAVRNGKADVGIVRSGILERMEQEGLLSLEDFSIVHEQTYEGFPYKVSTALYPEWSIAKLKHVPVESANYLASALLGLSLTDNRTIDTHEGWTVPIDYSPVHRLLKQLRLPPYDETNLTLKQFIAQYALWFYGTLVFLAVLVIHAVYSNRLNKQLEREVRKRTRALRKANHNLTTLSRTDPLTGLHNRRYFMEFAQQYISLAHRNATELQLLSLDIDHFKQVNDRYGHHIGDEILKLFATTLTPLLRTSDLLARTGGEEFVICLQNTTAEGATVFAEKILEAIRAAAYPLGNEMTVRITVSIGIASLECNQDLEDLLRRSDHALYSAKNNGRDQYVFEPPLTTNDKNSP
jgi:diguanylate cyclase (GGDEF)-like protein